ncbi:MAG TPA: GNVR domain-containing protein [Methylomirabilota bacterium]|nr:GNVR domain-containing protein [Methylomirabilota bacterium]
MSNAESPEPLRETHLKDYYRTLRKHRWLVTGLFLVIVFSVAVWSFVQTPVYQASATVLIEPEPPKVLNIQDVTPIGSPTQEYYRTQYELMTSRPIVEKVIETLGLRGRMPELARSADPVRTLQGAVTVEPRRNTRLVSVKFEHADPALATEVTNALARQYVKHNLDIKLRGAQEAMTWLNEQMTSLRGKVQESSVALQNYRVKAGIMGLSEQRQITAQKIIDFNKQYLEAQAQRLSVEAKMNELQRTSDRGGAQTIFTVADSPLIQKLKQEVADLETTKAKLSKIYKEKHPEILKVVAQIDQVNQRIDGETKNMLRAVQTEFRVAKAREETLLGNVNRLRTEAQELNEKEIQYLNLQRESDSNQQLYEAVLKRLKETGVTGGLETNNVSVIEEATPPRVPIRPRKTVNLVISVLVGLLVGVGTALTIEYFDTTVKTPDDVERYLGLPVIGIVPQFSTKR